MKTKQKKQMELSTAFNLLNAKSKNLIKIKIQNEAGWSEATFYHKIKSDENLNPLEYKALYKIMQTEISDTIFELQDLIKNLNNL